MRPEKETDDANKRFFLGWDAGYVLCRQRFEVGHVGAFGLAFAIRDFDEVLVDYFTDRHGFTGLAPAEADAFAADVDCCHGSDSPVSVFKFNCLYGGGRGFSRLPLRDGVSARGLLFQNPNGANIVANRPLLDSNTNTCRLNSVDLACRLWGLSSCMYFIFGPFGFRSSNCLSAS